MTTNTAIQIATPERLQIAPYTPIDIESVLAGRCMPNTIKMYARDFDAYRLFAGAAWLDPQSLEAWRDEMISASTKSPNTINRMLASIKSVIKRMARRKMLPADVALEFEQIENVSAAALRDRLKQNSKTQISAEQMRLICSKPNTATLAGKMHAALLHTLASSGLRIHEALKLKPGDIHPGQRRDGSQGFYLEVLGKGKSEKMEAQLSKEAKEAIDAWLIARQSAGIESEFVFTSFAGRGDSRVTSKQLTAPSAWLIIKRYAEAAGVANVKPHDFRRFVATEINSRHGLHTAKSLLRHSNVATTEKYILSDTPLGLTDNLY